MSIDRRRVVQAALLAAWWPGYWARASSAPWPADLGDGVRPRLLFVVPAAPAAHRARGEVLGALLNHGGDTVLAVLALCDVACVGAAEVVAAHRLAQAEEPWFVLVEPGGSLVRTAVVFVPPESAFPKRRKNETTRDVANAAFERLVRAASEQLVRLVLPDRSALVRYADAAGPDSEAALALDAWEDRGLALPTLQRLAMRGRFAWMFREIPGSRWWSHGGPCGGGGPDHPTPEERAAEAAEDRSLHECGMAYVSPLARRALRFL